MQQLLLIPAAHQAGPWVLGTCCEWRTLALFLQVPCRLELLADIQVQLILVTQGLFPRDRQCTYEPAVRPYLDPSPWAPGRDKDSVTTQWSCCVPIKLYWWTLKLASHIIFTWSERLIFGFCQHFTNVIIILTGCIQTQVVGQIWHGATVCWPVH